MVYPYSIAIACPKVKTSTKIGRGLYFCGYLQGRDRHIVESNNMAIAYRFLKLWIAKPSKRIVQPSQRFQPPRPIAVGQQQ
jgi:hypothetical protein